MKLGVLEGLNVPNACLLMSDDGFVKPPPPFDTNEIPEFSIKDATNKSSHAATKI